VGRGAGDDAGRLLTRLGWDGPVGGDGGRQAVGDAEQGQGWSEGAGGHGLEPRPRWRLAGVPPAVALTLLLVAVVAFVLLGRFPSGSGEVVVTGPAATGTAEPSAPVTLAAPAGAGGAETGRAAAEGAAVDGAAIEEALPGTSVVDGTPPAGPTAAAVADVGAVAGPVVVHVDGAVARPGVVRLPPGSRVGDAVAAAGGTTEEADTRGVNLARPLVDGEQVVVPRQGEELVVTAPAGPGVDPGSAGTAERGTGAGGTPGGGAGTGAWGAGAAGPGGAGAAAGVAGVAVVDLNTADAAELDGLPGIGPVLAERIVAWRAESGPFVDVEDLTEVSGIGPAVLDDVRDLVTV